MKNIEVPTNRKDTKKREQKKKQMSHDNNRNTKQPYKKDIKH